jgi:hypothetical protein
MDSSTTDNDVLNLTLTTAAGQDNITTLNIETVNINMAAASASLDAATMTGVKAVNVSGVVDDAVDDVAAAATIKLDGYTRALTINDTNFSGTTAAKNPDSMNVEVSGTTFGSTAATQSKVILTAGSASTLETLNVASSGSAANVYNLDAGSNVTLSTVNFTGGTAQTVRVAADDVTGKTLNADDATADVTLRVDMNSTSAALNATKYSGIDNLLMVDSTVGSDAASVSGVASGQKITIADDMDATTFTMAGATVSSQAASISVVLDNETANADLDVSNISIQNTATLNLESSGNADSTATTAENSTGTLSGDFTTITITGDTSLDTVLDIDGAGSAATTARTVVVDASANTAFVTIDAADDKYVSYEMTGTAGNDTLKLNNTAGSLTGGAGNDKLWTGDKNDTVVAGAGKDTVYASKGTDTISLGDGVDTLEVGQAIDVTAVAQVSTFDDITDTGTITMTAGDYLQITIDGSTYSEVYTTSEAQTVINFVANQAATILANHGVTVVAADTNKDIKLTGKADGTSFITTGAINDAGVIVVDTAAATTVAVEGVSVDIQVSDFEVGSASSGGDVLAFDVSAINGLVIDLSDGDGDVAASDDVVVIDYTVGTAFSDTDGTSDGQNLIKVGYTTSVNSASDVTTAIDAKNITLDNAMADGDAIAIVYYDADDGQAVFGLALQGGSDGASLDDDVTINELGSLTMTSAEYALLDASNFSFV